MNNVTKKTVDLYLKEQLNCLDRVHIIFPTAV